jgi:hypothetical protein
MNHPATCARPAALLLAASLAACVQPPAPALRVQAMSAPTPPAERLTLPLHPDDLDWASVGGGPLPGGGDMREYVPVGETIADWSQMITTLTLPASDDPAARLAAILGGLRGACRAYRVIQSATQETPYHSQTLLARCDHPDEAALADPNILLRKHEVIWAKTIQGRTQNYVVWRAWHDDTLPKDSVLSSATTRQQWQSWLNKVAIAGGV